MQSKITELNSRKNESRMLREQPESRDEASSPGPLFPLIGSVRPESP